MTDQERALALSLLKDKEGKYVLDDRARRECPDLVRYDLLHEQEPENPEQCRKCGGSGWLTTLVIEEPCPGRVVTVGAPYRDAEELHDEQCCGGSGTLYRPDTDRIIAVLEAAGCNVQYSTFSDVNGWTVYSYAPLDSLTYYAGSAPNILVAACQALGVEGTP